MLKSRRGDEGADAVAMDQLRLRASAGLAPSNPGALPVRVGRAVRVAEAAGAPLADALDGAQAAHDDVLKSQRALAVASAQARAVSIGLLAAPVVLVPGLGQIVGADLIGFYTSALGLAVLVVASALMAAGATMVVLLIRRIGRAGRPRDSAVGGGGGRAHGGRGRGLGGAGAIVIAGGAAVMTWMLLTPVLAPLAALFAHHVVSSGAAEPAPVGVDEAADLAATALAGGVSVPEALRIAADELDVLAPRLRRLAFGLELGVPAEVLRANAPDDIDRMFAVLSTAEDVGAPAVPTLRRLAKELRADELARVLAAAERLPAQLTFPTALCLLPATVLLIGAPIVHTGVEAAGLS